MNNNDLDAAKISYQKALSFKSDESYPKDQITKIETQLAAKEKLEENYTSAIKEGDDALSAKEYEKSKAAFQKASALKSEEDYPKNKVSEIDGILAELKGKQELYTKAIEKGDNAFNSGEFELAKTAFEEAIAIKDDAYPKGKITEIEAKLVELAAKKEKQEKLEADYQAAIAEGDKNAGEKNYDAAISSFNAALALKPNETYPADKVKALTEEKNNVAEAERLAVIQKEYDAIITKADAAYDSKKLEEAKTEYQAALALKVDEAHPKGRIDEINQQLANAEAEDKNYKEAISAADNFLVEEKYEEAKAKYAIAAAIKPAQEFPREKIKEIDEKLADLAAEQEEIRLQNEKTAELEANYQAAIAEADALFNTEKYEEAKPKYETAITFKEDQYPKDKIVEIAAKLSSIAEKAAADAAQAKIDEAYQALITEADGLFDAANYETAKTKYEAAIAVKDEQYPKDKITEIATKIAELSDQAAAEAVAAEQARIDGEYQTLITEADGLFDAANYEAAKIKYEAAIAVKDEQYPKDKITEIATKIAALSDQAAAEAVAAEQARIDGEYQTLITEADGLFDAANYETAKTKYEAATAVKDEQYPKDKITEIATKIAAL
ncbi:MAG: hypothetical protein JKY48_04240, partial [Flavobacteriales bacterium]|nr:hypothetical protein [Flavobacteriales bacterium]